MTEQEMTETEYNIKVAEYQESYDTLKAKFDATEIKVEEYEGTIGTLKANEAKLNAIIAKNLLTREAPAGQEVQTEKTFGEMYKAAIESIGKE